MKKYNMFLRNITELIEKSLFTSKDLKKDVEDSLKSKMEIVANKLKLVSREEFDVQKKIVEKLQKDLIKLKTQKIVKKTPLDPIRVANGSDQGEKNSKMERTGLNKKLGNSRFK